MPKVVDHDARRREIADALLRVVARDGVTAVSVRSVAAEAGLSVGAMRHTAASQPELIAFAMRAVSERVAARLADLLVEEPDRDGLVAVCLEVLPLDAQRRTETAVWFELVALARTEPDLAGVSEQAHRDLRALMRAVVDAAHPGLAPPHAASEAVRLHATLDGLALHEVLHPGGMGASEIEAVVRAALAPRS